MPDAQMLELIEGLERRIAHLEILEDPIRITRLDHAHVSTGANWVLAVAVTWTEDPNSPITITLTEPGYLWIMGHASWFIDIGADRRIAVQFQVAVDGVRSNRVQAFFVPDIDAGKTKFMNVVFSERWGFLMPAGVYTVSYFAYLYQANDILTVEDRTFTVFWTRE